MKALKRFFTDFFDTVPNTLAIIATLLAITLMIAGLITGKIHFYILAVLITLLGYSILNDKNNLKNNKL